MALDFNCGSNVVTGFSRNNPRERGQERECLRATTSARGRPTEGEITGENSIYDKTRGEYFAIISLPPSVGEVRNLNFALNREKMAGGHHRV